MYQVRLVFLIHQGHNFIELKMANLIISENAKTQVTWLLCYDEACRYMEYIFDIKLLIENSQTTFNDYGPHHNMVLQSEINTGLHAF